MLVNDMVFMDDVFKAKLFFSCCYALPPKVGSHIHIRKAPHGIMKNIEQYTVDLISGHTFAIKLMIYFCKHPMGIIALNNSCLQ